MEIVKKHYKQMCSADFRYIRAKVRNVNKMLRMGLQLKLTQHTYDKIDYGNANNVNKSIIRRLLNNYEVIEYKLILKEGCADNFCKDDILDERVVLRSTFTINNDSENVVLVLSLKNNIIITSWNNKVEDRHKNVDLSQYTLKSTGVHCLV